MASLYRTALILLILQVYVSAAPSDATKKTEKQLEKLDAQPSPVDEKIKVNSNENQRQKRYYNHIIIPPYNPPPFLSYHKRDQSADLGVYGLVEDPLSGIHKRLQEIASATRQIPPPQPPPITPHLPLFFPVFFIPQFGCQCDPPSTTSKPKPQGPTSDKPASEGTTPTIENRIPVLEDERQNFGLVNDDTEEDDNGEDFSRPISFDPITLNVSTLRPAPPVEHGSNQAGQGGVGVQDVTTTTVKPAPPSSSKVPSPSLVGTAAAAPYPPSVQPSKQSPSTCDSAVLSCCHRPKVTYDCFAALGCPDPTSYGNPCDPLVILKVVSKFQSFYGVKTG